MATFNKGRVAFTICSAIVMIASLVLGIVFAVQANFIFTPMFVIFGVTFIYCVSYLLAHLKDKDATDDIELGLVFVTLVVLFVVAVPVCLILWVVELIVEAIADAKAKKSMKTLK